MQCRCGRYVERVSDNAIAVKCPYCVINNIPIDPYPQKKKYIPTGRPRGWAFMNEFVDKDGNVYHRGKIQPKLKGTLAPTVIKSKKKTKRKTKQQKLVAREKKKRATLLKDKKKKQKEIKHLIKK